MQIRLLRWGIAVGTNAGARPQAGRAVGALAMALALAAAVFFRGAWAAESPRVVTSIVPVHSLVAGVMAGVGEPTLLIDGQSSPHSYTLRPTAARALANAEAVFWIGPDLETFLAKPVAALAKEARAVALMAVPEMMLWPLRMGGAWGEGDAHAEEPAAGDAATEDSEAHPVHGRVDPHIWLSPQNARRIVRTAAAVLSDVDPANGETYGANAARLERELIELEAELESMLAPVRAVPFIVFHDSYRYVEARFGLTAVGAFALNPAIAPGARRLGELRERIIAGNVACVFVEPQFAPAAVHAAIRGTSVRVAVLDPLGAGIKPGPDAYFRVLRNLAMKLATCLGATAG